uniref:ChiA1-BD-binding domain protein n=1 Tax=Myoviridae sp. ctk6V34 TaxID=2825164 RepID=A0A8S5V3K5_9CAUD|nr:MAG TPA: ChiA1-BD-binding domain protein [Myoviridae sp. ctk6V34]
MSLTNNQKQLIELVSSMLPTAPAEIAQKNVDWYKQWSAGEKLSVGDRRAYEGILYEVVQAHTMQSGWEPPNVPALFKRVWTEEWPEWAQPTGAHDAYAKGAKVTHNGKKWISTADNNVWEPGVYGWEEIE